MIRLTKWMMAAAMTAIAFAAPAWADVGSGGAIATTEAALLTHGAVVLGLVGLGLFGWYLRKRA